LGWGVENEMQKRAEEDEEGRSIGLGILKDWLKRDVQWEEERGSCSSLEGEKMKFYYKASGLVGRVRFFFHPKATPFSRSFGLLYFPPPPSRPFSFSYINAFISTLSPSFLFPTLFSLYNMQSSFLHPNHPLVPFSFLI
jgi:hypothetical protein